MIQAVREAKVDTLVMKHFLSGFSDDDAKLILKHCSEVLPKQANILLLQVRNHRMPAYLQPASLRDATGFHVRCDVC